MKKPTEIQLFKSGSLVFKRFN